MVTTIICYDGVRLYQAKVYGKTRIFTEPGYAVAWVCNVTGRGVRK